MTWDGPCRRASETRGVTRRRLSASSEKLAYESTRMLKKSLMVMAIGSAVGGPYVASEWPKIKSSLLGDSSTTVSANHGAKSPPAGSHGTPNPAGHSGSTI